jgi:geranylgeranyl diphosphate synthase type I
VDRALQVVRYKSAKYTIERPLHIGAALADAPESVFEAYSGYGLPLGEAFQLRDDVLGVFGDPEQTGKPAGDDLREGKRTVLIAIAAERADETQGGHLRVLLGDPGLDASGVATLRAIIEDTGALEHTESMIDDLLQRSLTALTDAGIDDQARQVLTGLAYAATRRSV